MKRSFGSSGETHTTGERCCGQRWGYSREFRVFVSDLISQQWDWRKLPLWRKKHCALKAAKQHHMLQRTLSWREVSTHVADFTVILFEGSNCLPDWATTSLITNNSHPTPPKRFGSAESLGASCHFLTMKYFNEGVDIALKTLNKV